MKTTVTGRNQVTIPAKLAADYGITNGSRLEWLTTPEADVLKVRILPGRAALAAEVQAIGMKYKKPGRNLAKDLIRDRMTDEQARTEVL